LLEHELWLYACRNPDARRALAERYGEARRLLAEGLSEGLGAPVGADISSLVIALVLGLEMQRRVAPEAIDDETALAGLRAVCAARLARSATPTVTPASR
jgi:hypothetical protein